MAAHNLVTWLEVVRTQLGFVLWILEFEGFRPRSLHIWGFPQMEYPQIIHRWIFLYEPSFLGYPHSWKPPFGANTSLRTLAAPQPSTTCEKSVQASMLQQQGRYAEAASLQRETLEVLVSTMGPRHPDTLTVKSALGSTLEQCLAWNEAWQV